MSPRFLSIIAVLGVSSGAIASLAAAQIASSVQALAGPRTLRAVHHQSVEHGCGESFGSSSAELAIALSIDGAGAATLVLDGHSRSFIASRDGSGSSDTGHALAGVAHGHASLGADGRLTVRFVDLDAATAYWSGPGTLPVGPSSSRPFAHTLVCSIATASLLPAGAPTPGEVGTATSLARCAWAAGAPTELMGYATGDLWLGAANGIEVFSDDTLMEPGTVVTLRAR